MNNTGFYKLMNEFIFDCFVKNKLPLHKTLELFKEKFNGKIESFSESFCYKYISDQYGRFEKNKNPIFIKMSSFEETVINRFVMNKSNEAFLPQTELAKIYNVSQKTISIWISKMIADGYFSLKKRYHSSMRKSSEYILSIRGIKLFDRIMMSIINMTKKIHSNLHLIKKMSFNPKIITPFKFNGFYDENGNCIETPKQREVRINGMLGYDIFSNAIPW